MTDRELIEIADEFRSGVLGGRSPRRMCMAVSAPLQGFLSAVCGLETELEEVDFGHCNHVWLRITDGRILDATADQFAGTPRVYLGGIPDVYRDMMVESGE